MICFCTNNYKILSSRIFTIEPAVMSALLFFITPFHFHFTPLLYMTKIWDAEAENIIGITIIFE